MMYYENMVCVADYIYVETRDTLLLVGHLYGQHNFVDSSITLST